MTNWWPWLFIGWVLFSYSPDETVCPTEERCACSEEETEEERTLSRAEEEELIWRGNFNG